MAKKNKIPPRLAAKVREYLGVDEQERINIPENYLNPIKGRCDYRHIPKKSKQFFEKNGNRRHVRVVEGSPSPYYYARHDDKWCVIELDSRTYYVKVIAHSAKDWDLEFLFIRPFLEQKNGRKKLCKGFDSFVKRNLGSSELSKELEKHEDEHLDEEDVVWAVDDIIRTLVDINKSERDKNPKSDKIEINITICRFKDKKPTYIGKNMNESLETAEFLIKGYHGKSDTREVYTSIQLDSVPQ